MDNDQFEKLIAAAATKSKAFGKTIATVGAVHKRRQKVEAWRTLLILLVLPFFFAAVVLLIMLIHQTFSQ